MKIYLYSKAWKDMILQEVWSKLCADICIIVWKYLTAVITSETTLKIIDRFAY